MLLLGSFSLLKILKADKMVTKLRRTLESILDDIPWMDNVTRSRAREKVPVAST